MDLSDIQAGQHADREPHEGGIHRVRRGKVDCPIRGEIDVEICFYCPFLRGLEMDKAPARVACTPKQDLTPQERTAYKRYTVLQMAEFTGNVSEACRQCGISRRKYYEYKQRYMQHGMRGLED